MTTAVRSLGDCPPPSSPATLATGPSATLTLDYRPLAWAGPDPRTLHGGGGGSGTDQARITYRLQRVCGTELTGGRRGSRRTRTRRPPQAATRYATAIGARQRGAGVGSSRATRRCRAFAGVSDFNLFSDDIAVGVELDEPLLTADQVAELLAVPRSSVYEYARRIVRPLPSLEVGRHRRFYRSDVESWLTTMRARAR